MKPTYRSTRGDPCLMSALRFAAIAHDGQHRKGPDHLPYLDHVLDVVDRVNAFDETTQIIAALHDVIEDTPFTQAEIEAEFGEYVSETVKHLTVPEQYRKDPGKKLKCQIDTMALMDYRGLAVKIADKTANLNSLVHTPPGWGRKVLLAYVASAREVVEAAPPMWLIRKPALGMLVKEFQEVYDRTVDSL